MSAPETERWWSGPHFKGYGRQVRAWKRWDAEERNMHTPPERRRATRRLIEDLRCPPLVVHDVMTWAVWLYPGWLDLMQAWLRAHAIDPRVTHRVEVWQLGAELYARVFQFWHDGTGKMLADADGEPVRRVPFLVAVTTMPPALP